MLPDIDRHSGLCLLSQYSRQLPVLWARGPGGATGPRPDLTTDGRAAIHGVSVWLDELAHNCGASVSGFAKLMSAAIQRALAPLGLFATLLTSGAGVAAPANTTPADNCFAAPNTAAPPGHHWYYRTDRATQRKCWYVRAPGQPAQQATAPPRKSTAKSMDSTSDPSGPLPAAEAAPTPVNSADAGRLPPQIEVPASAPPDQRRAERYAVDLSRSHASQRKRRAK